MRCLIYLGLAQYTDFVAQFDVRNFDNDGIGCVSELLSVFLCARAPTTTVARLGSSLGTRPSTTTI